MYINCVIMVRVYNSFCWSNLEDVCAKSSTIVFSELPGHCTSYSVFCSNVVIYIASAKIIKRRTIRSPYYSNREEGRLMLRALGYFLSDILMVKA